MKLVMAWIVAIPLANGVAHAADNPEWQSLFDGKSLTGWKQVNGTAPYEVVDGAIVGTTRAGTPNSFLAPDKSYGDFVLELEAKQTVGPAEFMDRRWTSILPNENGLAVSTMRPSPGLASWNAAASCCRITATKSASAA